ncbi:hypothetical protein B0T24DRAFT_680776 [Lasiosphaeria ovina]|uniref:Survival motor neuron Tudor domain-containing protein n=1 Tax=Lasiosphaeria ovina TaxID=92902 RepID=A0AAE0N5P7_9PEZI|nr:hypothetical protein B0T24DRAFT_680776 [Lasiosphaeria ovina]
MEPGDADLAGQNDWDDASIVENWDRTVNEYKKYHSLHLAGGTVEDMIQRGEEDQKNWDAKPETAGACEPVEGDGVEGDVDSEVAAQLEASSAPVSVETRTEITLDPAQGSTADAQKADGPRSGPDGRQASQTGQDGNGRPAAFGPETLLGSVQDEGLRRLLMSWYYAGYYTGLHQGQQQGLNK